MNQLSAHQKQYLKETFQKVVDISRKIKLGRSMSSEEVDTIQKEIDDVKGTLFMFSDIHGNVEHIELYKEATDILENVLNLTSGARRYDHLV
ncbi:hypothetical protein U737_09685 [Methylomonas sp. LW13]|uniref:hypothetical protein n=1 Tax=unclassified Methylomonas TaxID=2608980 RepID=UPI00051C46F2|nr:hypothetical protein [Methylomonas sp. LW13]QBC27150.1 hypothetical protein U737_09685 [Methylomonas sp. LW13]